MRKPESHFETSVKYTAANKLGGIVEEHNFQNLPEAIDYDCLLQDARKNCFAVGQIGDDDLHPQSSTQQCYHR